MKTSFPRVVVALLALAFIVAACASDSGSTWTFAPTTASTDAGGTTTEAESAQPAATEVPPAEQAEAPTAEPPVEPATAPAGAAEPRVIELQADSALRFTDADGQPVPDIAVTPGETIVFRIDNTAGFPHNFWIGSDAELSAPNGVTDAGLEDWSTGVQELEWVVPEDLTGLKFACTVPGHYYTMQGTFSPAAAAAEPAEAPATEPPTEQPAEQPPTEQPAEAVVPGEPRVIEFEADAAIRFMQDGEQMRDIAVTPGETIVFRIDNTAGFPHNFYIGADQDLQVPNGMTDTGLPDWDTGIQELEWVVPEDVTDLRFACTVPGHYYTMQGDFTISP